ncbi:SusC/RagA family TonB-linked outer membrane protein [Pedobacter metabolipauper]|uniref:TonB-linked SusC/RagA family outer membrane protein n=1 Tax=Pedobacter metabolipauper TaxID=425513 RepID=A0A4R6SUL4_9SPHI|nr:TonB-dependent receptor [Pedobacter metabolipauper]TDQ09498.1 TonB-linked SusC/RagA family outer membrane protein [Pedobacter metabolipauper]
MKKLLQSLFILMLVAVSAMAQNRTVTGTVTDETNKPLPGVSVKIKGAQGGTLTSSNGTFSISVPSSATSLEFSYLGFVTKSVTLGTATVINASLIEDSKDLNEVIVVAYGTVRKENFTGSASVVSSKNLADRPTSSFQKSLQGAATGVQVTSVSGQPGGATTIRVRGIGSLSAGSSPLYVIDGIATTSGDLTQVAATSDILSSLNPNDIESISILKDATAAGLYGSRAANGVVLITTKQGKAGNTRFTASATGGYSSQATEKHETLSALEYYKLYFDNYYIQRIAAGLAPDAAATAANTLTRNRLSVNPFNTAQPFVAGGTLAPGAALFYDTDWRDEVLRRGVTKDVNVSASGGSEKLKFYVSGGYFDQKGIIIGSDFKRYSGKINLSNDVNEFLSFGVNTTLARSDQNTPAGAGGGANPVRFADINSNIYSLYVRDASGAPVRDAQGKLVYNYVNPVSPDFNPVGLNELDEYNTLTSRVNLLPYIQVKFLNGFTAKSTVGIDYANLRERQFYNPLHGNGVSVNGRGYRYSREDITTTYLNTLVYDKSIGKHNINVLIGQEAFRNKQDNIYAQATNYAFAGAGELVTASTPNTATSNFNELTFSSYFSRLTYDYDSKYYFSGSFRRDGSSVFGPNNKYGNFYSLGGAWRISQEEFFSGVTFLDELKLRGSYGISGNNTIGRYASQALYALARNYDGNGGTFYNQLANPDLQWEKNSTTEFGIEFAALKRRLSGEIAYYKRGSEGLLFNQPISRIIGFTSVATNLASMDNSGIEIMLNGTPIQTEDFTWNLSVNVSSNSNRVRKLTQNEVLDGTKLLKVGSDRYQWYLREYAGIDQADGRPMWYMDDASGNKVTTKTYSAAKLYTGLGSASPDWFGGASTSLAYKGFDLSAYASFTLGGKIYDNLYAALMHNGISPGQQMSKDVLNAWSATNTTSSIPRFLTNSNTDLSNSVSSRFLYSGSYMRVKNITLGYTLDKAIASKAKLSNVRVFLMAENPFTIAAHKGMDPEADIAGTSNNDIPNIKTFSAGLSIGF